MFSFEHADFRYEPYPIGLIKPVMDPGLYETLVEAFPPVELFKFMPKLGNKYTLSEKFNPQNYHRYVTENEPWRELHAWIKSESFFRAVDDMLRANDIDLGLAKARFTGQGKWRWRLAELARGRWPRGDISLRSRFEFSMLPADGGYVPPHTDTPRKIITLVVSMVGADGWDPALGGGTEVNRPKDHRHAYNWLNEALEFDEVERLDVFDFTPNQCVVFVKTFNSLHCVSPMQAKGSSAMRRTLTVNIEYQDY